MSFQQSALSKILDSISRFDDANWVEADHPRDADGKFTNKAGGGNYKLSDLKKIGGQKGSNPGGLYETPEGKKLYVKESKSPNHAKNEALASELYQAVGVPTLPVEVIKGEGKDKLATATEWQSLLGFDPNNENDLQDAQKYFAVHAWLANWDAVGLANDNQAYNQKGEMVTLDVGGALEYRAQGGEKGAAFGDDPLELKSLKDVNSNPQAAAVFGSMTDEQFKESAKMLQGIDDAQIKELVEKYGPGDDVHKQELAGKLIKRRDAILKEAGLLGGNKSEVPGEGFNAGIPKIAASQGKPYEHLHAAATDGEKTKQERIEEIEKLIVDFENKYKGGYLKSIKAYGDNLKNYMETGKWGGKKKPGQEEQKQSKAEEKKSTEEEPGEVTAILPKGQSAGDKALGALENKAFELSAFVPDIPSKTLLESKYAALVDIINLVKDGKLSVAEKKLANIMLYPLEYLHEPNVKAAAVAMNEYQMGVEAWMHGDDDNIPGTSKAEAPKAEKKSVLKMLSSKTSAAEDKFFTQLKDIKSFDPTLENHPLAKKADEMLEEISNLISENKDDAQALLSAVSKIKPLIDKGSISVQLANKYLQSLKDDLMTGRAANPSPSEKIQPEGYEKKTSDKPPSDDKSKLFAKSPTEYMSPSTAQHVSEKTKDQYKELTSMIHNMLDGGDDAQVEAAHKAADHLKKIDEFSINHGDDIRQLAYGIGMVNDLTHGGNPALKKIAKLANDYVYGLYADLSDAAKNAETSNAVAIGQAQKASHTTVTPPVEHEYVSKAALAAKAEVEKSLGLMSSEKNKKLVTDKMSEISKVFDPAVAMSVSDQKEMLSKIEALPSNAYSQGIKNFNDYLLELKSDFAVTPKQPDTGAAPKQPDDNIVKPTKPSKGWQKANEFFSKCVPVSDAIQKHLIPTGKPNGWNNVTGAPLAAAKAYTGSKYSLMNEALRSSDPTSTPKSVVAMIQHIDDLFEDDELSVINENVTVFRGENVPPKRIAMWQSILKSNLRAHFNKVGFTSCRSTEGGYASTSNVQYEIAVPKGKRMLDMKPISHHPGENELLLPHGISFEVLSVEKIGHEKYKVKVVLT